MKPSDMFRTKGVHSYVIEDQREWLKPLWKFWLLHDVFLSPALEPDLPKAVLGGVKAEGPRLVLHGLWVFWLGSVKWGSGEKNQSRM